MEKIKLMIINSGIEHHLVRMNCPRNDLQGSSIRPNRPLLPADQRGRQCVIMTSTWSASMECNIVPTFSFFSLSHTFHVCSISQIPGTSLFHSDVQISLLLPGYFSCSYTHTHTHVATTHSENERKRKKTKSRIFFLSPRHPYQSWPLPFICEEKGGGKKEGRALNKWNPFFETILSTPGGKSWW